MNSSLCSGAGREKEGSQGASSLSLLMSIKANRNGAGVPPGCFRSYHLAICSAGAARHTGGSPRFKAVSQIIAVFALQFAASLLSGVFSFTARACRCHLLKSVWQMALGITSAAKNPQLKEVLSCSALCLAARLTPQMQGCAEHNSHVQKMHLREEK